MRLSALRWLAALALLCLSLCSHSVDAYSLAPPLVAPPATPPFTPAAPIPADRTAYVAIHFDDWSSRATSLDSESSFDGIRTLMASLADPKRGNTKRDRVVLVPSHTSAAVRAQYAADGLIVLEMDSTLPHRDLCAPKFDRIYLWSPILAARYDRVVYLDWDVLAERNMDELFLCGKFCMVYNSILHFVDGLMVVQPDSAVFDAMADAYKRMRLSSAWDSGSPLGKGGKGGGMHVLPAAPRGWTSSSKGVCWERSYLFFLEWFGNLEAAPLFDRRYGQSPLPLQRLAASAQLNAMMWYEKYSWTLMRGKEYRNMSNDQEVPALSLGFTTLKPFHWAPGVFFNLGWHWSDVRDSYLGVTHTWFMLSRALLWALLFAAVRYGLPRAMLALYRPRNTPPSGVVAFLRRAHLKVMGPTEGYARDDGDELTYVSASLWSLPGYWLPLYGSDVLGIVCGILQFVGVAFVLTYWTALIPQLTHPHPAWRVWIAFHILLIYALNHWTYLSYHAATPLLSAQAGAELLRARAEAQGSPLPARTTPVSPPALPSLPTPPPLAALNYPFWSSMGWLIFWEVTKYVLMRRTFYPEFVVKMFVLFPILAAMLIACININRAVWRDIDASRMGMAMGVGVAGAKAAAEGHAGSVPMQQLLPGGGAPNRR